MRDLNHYIPICVSLRRLMPNTLEIVLHDLTSGKVAYIENSFSPRKIGDDSLLDTANYEVELRSDYTIGPYQKSNSDGSKIKSVSSLIKDDEGIAIGLLCINLRVNALEAASQILQEIVSITSINVPAPILKNDWRELANSIISKALGTRKLSLNSIRRSDRIDIVRELAAAEVFEARGSVDYVAEALGVSRANIYELLKSSRENTVTELVTKNGTAS